ncbi:Phosphoglycerate transport system sensor protein pgtB [Plesiomonas shigelloides]|uniref:ATP-binding protein n=1 Tax=Plesiomonas shigelloides TaxID=703 RepID=UPI000D9AAA4B|nr:ATP-binding protein [Plesiomonas shigelloides]SPZ37775.1 Phosphoglycerate transport system sensor protein pgtB [Plesiomonas shigelloides]
MLAHFPLGKRLMLFCLLQSSLTFITGCIGYFVWSSLSNNITTTLASNISAVNAQHEIDTRSNQLLLLVADISNASAITDIIRKEHKINTVVTELENLTDTQDTHLRAINQKVKALTFEQSKLIKHKIALSNQLVKARDLINALHYDAIEEARPLLQEISWNINGQIHYSHTKESVTTMLTELSYMQQLVMDENELTNLLNEVSADNHHRDVNQTFLFIQTKIDDINRSLEVLKSYPSTVSHRQIISALLLLAKYNGELHSTINQLRATDSELASVKKQLNSAITEYKAQIGQSLLTSKHKLQTLIATTNATTQQGNKVLFIILLVTTSLSLFTAVVLIKKHFINRLNVLSSNISKVIRQTDYNIAKIDGHDEISALSNELHAFCAQMKEIQRLDALNLINNTHACIITCKTNGLIESINSKAAEVLHYIDDRPKMIWELFSDKNQKVIQALFGDQSASRYQQGHEIIISHMLDAASANETEYYSFYINTYQQGAKDKFIITLTDITKQELNRKRLQRLVNKQTESLRRKNIELKTEIQQRIQMQDDLIQTAKMAVLGQTMTSLAHELNQPLSAMNMYLYTTHAQAIKSGDQTLQASIEKISALAERMRKIITNLRAFSKKSPQATTLTVCDVNTLVQDSLALVESRAKNEQCSLYNHIPNETLWPLNQTHFEQILINLYVNALDAMAGSTKSVIHVDLLDYNTRNLTLSVSDSGNGFAPDIVEKLFTPFISTKEVGLGLGLSISRSLAKGLHGDIYLASALNKGAMIILEFNHD